MTLSIIWGIGNAGHWKQRIHLSAGNSPQDLGWLQKKADPSQIRRGMINFLLATGEPTDEG
jgi:hypothetical protein